MVFTHTWSTGQHQTLPKRCDLQGAHTHLGRQPKCSHQLVFDDAAVVNYTGYAPLGPDGQHLFLLLLLMFLLTSAFSIQMNTHGEDGASDTPWTTLVLRLTTQTHTPLYSLQLVGKCQEHLYVSVTQHSSLMSG